jgi:hypothetical protein
VEKYVNRSQLGFRKNKSTYKLKLYLKHTGGLRELYNTRLFFDLSEAHGVINLKHTGGLRELYVTGLFYDLSEAHSVINHNMLLEELNSYGKTSEWFKATPVC